MENQPVTWKTELWILVSLSVPNIVAQTILEFGIQFSVIFGATLGDNTFTESGLGFTLLYGLGFSVIRSFTSATETTLSQTYGWKKKQVGLVVQRALLLAAMVMSLDLSGLLLCGWLFAFVAETEQLMTEATRFVHASLLMLAAFIVFQIMLSILLLQQKLGTVITAYCITTTLSISMQVLFVKVLRLGMLGSGLATGVALLVTDLGLVVYMLKFGCFDEIWDGWKKEAWLNWGTYAKLICSGVVMLMITNLFYDGSIYLTSALSLAELRAQIVCSQMLYLCYRGTTVPITVATLRIGEHLGRGDAASAHLSAKLVVAFCFCYGIVLGFVLIALQKPIIHFFVENPESRDVAGTSLYLLALSMFLICTSGALWAILSGVGKQFILSAINVPVILLSVPLTLTLMFYTPLRSHGFWIALSVGIFVQFIIMLLYISRLDWELEARKAIERSQKDASYVNLDDNTLQNVSKATEHSHLMRHEAELAAVYSEPQLQPNQLGESEQNNYDRQMFKEPGELQKVTIKWFLRRRLPVILLSAVLLLTALFVLFYFPPDHHVARRFFLSRFGNYSFPSASKSANTSSL